MTSRPPEKFGDLPPSVSLEETLAHQLERDRPYGGPEGGGGAVDGDGD